MRALVYSKENCPFCVKAKTLLTIKKIDFTEIEIGKDMTREDFVSLFPDQKTVPLIFIDEQRVGGFDELTRYFDNQRTSK